MALLHRPALALSQAAGTSRITTSATTHNNLAILAKHETVTMNPASAAVSKLGAILTTPTSKNQSATSSKKRFGFLGNLQLDLNFNRRSAGMAVTTPRSPKSLFEQRMRMSPTKSPKEMLGDKWKEYHGCNNWDGLIHPHLDANLRRELIKYGEFSQATYDAFDYDSNSPYLGSCRYGKQRMFQMLGLRHSGYNVSKYLYALSMGYDSNWMGYVAVSDDQETLRLGRRDILVAWRGTVTQAEWLENVKEFQCPIDEDEDASVKVHGGFLSIYKSKPSEECSRFGNLSASEQVIAEVSRLVEMYTQRGEQVSVTLTGHSLGGALALLTAHELALGGISAPISVFSFAAPRVGNIAFRDSLDRLGVKTLRIVSRQDLVPKLPGIIFNEGLANAMPWMSFVHVGCELCLDYGHSPFLRPTHDPSAFHNLEAYLHLLDGFESEEQPYRPQAKRDVTLINKFSDMLRKELQVPPNWSASKKKENGLGRWVRPDRHPDDLPSPLFRRLPSSSDLTVAV